MNIINTLYISNALIPIVIILILISHFYNNGNILKLSSQAIMIFFIEYLFISAVLLYIDIFRVKYVLIFTLVINIIILALNIKKVKKVRFDKIDFDIKKSMLILFLILLILPFVHEKSESISTGYDAGLYGAKAISLMFGETTSTVIIKEYSIDGASMKDSVLKLQGEQQGLYEKKLDNDIYGYEYHGLPTWPALMSLFGKMFGIRNMSYVLSVLYSLSALYIYYILDNLNAKKFSKYLGAFLFLFLPLSIYLAKNSLSEMLYVAILLFSILLLTEKNEKLKLVSGLSIGCLGFVHFSTLVYFPILYGILMIMHIYTRKQIFAKINMIQSIIFCFSVQYSMKTSSVYTTVQLKNMFGSILNNMQLIMIVQLIIVLVIIIQFIVYYLILKDKIKIVLCIESLLDKYGMIVFKLLLIFLLFVTLYKGYLLGFTDRYISGEGGTWIRRQGYANKGFYSLLYHNIFSIMSATSYLCIPIIVYKIFNNKYEMGKIERLMCLALIYSLMVNLMLRVDTPKNYYASRYFYIYIVPIVFILISMIIKNKKNCIIVGITALITGLPFNIVLMNAKEYKGNHEVLYDAVSLIEKDSIVIVDNNYSLNKLLVTNLREINNVLVFSSDIMSQVIKKYGSENIYYITGKQLEDSEFKRILKKDYDTSGEIASGSNLYPINFRYDKTEMNIYSIYQNKTIINFEEKDKPFISGFNGLEKNGEEGFSWCSEKSSFKLEFNPSDMNVIRVHYYSLPQYVFNKKDSINIIFEINNNIVFESTLTRLNNESGFFDLIVSKDELTDGKVHEINMNCDTWSPINYENGNSDSRKLGIAITKVELLEE